MARIIRLEARLAEQAITTLKHSRLSLARHLARCIVVQLTTHSVRPNFTRLFGPYSQYSHHKAKDIYKI